ncbi:MAG TPA: complex I subunit 1 family protein [Burkholderiales bacterium]|nr:complex I subunit 1 family protein [Burkholderiales bacterium]
MNELARVAFALSIWPGMLGATALGLLYLWVARKLTARLQGRRGPPFYQPLFDLVKLLGKRTVVPRDANRGLFYALPVVAVAATALGLVVVPVPGNPVPSFPGDVVLLLFLLEVPVFCDVLAGYVTQSIYGQVSAMREGVLMLGYNVPFLGAVVAMAQHAGSFSLSELHGAPWGAVCAFAAIAFLLAIPARLKSNPFSIPNAEQEIVAGAHIEYNGAPLALFELSHALEVVLLVNLFMVLFVPSVGDPATDALLYLASSIALVCAVTAIAALTARMTVVRAFRFYWVWGGIAAVASMAAAVVS